MEPANLDPSWSDGRPIDALLRQPPPALPDAGFTHRVLAALPAKPSARRVPSRAVLCTLAATAGVVLVVVRGPSVQTFVASLARLGDTFANASTELASFPDHTFPGAGLVIALSVTALSLLYAFSANARAALRSFV